MIIAEAGSDPAVDLPALLAARVLIPLLLLSGILKCVTVSRRPTASFKCVLALALWLGGCLMFSIGGLWLPGNSARYWLTGLLWLAAFGLVISAVVVGIVGLVEYANQPGRYRQGRAQAIWALGLCAFTLFSAGLGAVIAISLNATREAEVEQRAASQPIVFKDLNFKFTPPGRPWTRMNAQRLNRDARLAFLRSHPDIFFIIIPERVGSRDFTTESVAEIALANLNSAAESSRVLDRFYTRSGPLNGLRVHTEARVSGYDIFYVQWFFATNGWSYQLMTWGGVKDKELVKTAATECINRFQMIEPDLPPPRTGVTSTEFISTNYQFRVRCADSKWIAWPKLDTDCAYASFGVLHREGAALAVTAVDLTDVQPGTEALYQGGFNVSGLFTDVDPLATATPVREKKLEGYETTVTREVESGKEYTYRLKVLQHGGFAWLVAAWVESKHPRKTQLLNEAFANVEFLDGDPVRPDPARMTVREKRVHRMVLNAIGMVYYRADQYDASARFFNRALELDGLQKNTPYLANVCEAYSAAGKLHEALDVLDRHPEFIATQPELLARQAFLQGQCGLIEAALTNYAKLFSSGYNNEEKFEDYVTLLGQNDTPEKALNTVETYLQQHDTPGVRLLQARFLKQLKKYDQAITLLEAQHQKNPFHQGIACSLGDTYIQVGRGRDALQLSEELLKSQGPSLRVWYLKGRAEYSLKWYREARTSFEQAAKESPADQNVQDYLQTVSSALGEGSTAGIRDPINPVPVPAELLAPPAVPADFGHDEGACYLRNVRAVSFKKGKEFKLTDFLTVKMLTVEGVSDFSTFQIGFNPLIENIYVNELLVKNAAGSLVSTGRVADYYVLDERGSSTVNARKVLNIPVAGLQPACTVELTVTRQELGTPDEFTFQAFNFSRGYPTLESTLYFVGDTQAVRYASSPSQEPQRLASGWCWRTPHPLVARWEPLLPPVRDYLPTVWLSDASARWPDLVTNYLDTIHDRLSLDAPERELAVRLTAQCTNTQQKIAAIADYVQTNYTYKAIEFGRRARVPQFTRDIVRNKYGDCKDHALLAQQLLIAAGVPASLALVNSDGTIRKDLPSIDQFDHMIVEVPEPTGDVFLDCTDKGARLGETWTPGLAGHDALVLDALDPRFVRIADYPTNASRIQVERAIQFTNQTEMQISESLVFEGVYAGYLRSYLAEISAASRHAYVSEQVLGSSGELLDLVINGLDEPRKPLELKLVYQRRGQFHLLPGQFIGSLPLGIERTYLTEEPIAKRTLPFQVAVPLIIDSTVTVAAPAGYRTEATGEPARQIMTPFVICDSTSDVHRADWRFHFHLYRPAGRFGPGDYTGFGRAMQDAIHQLEPRLAARKGP